MMRYSTRVYPIIVAGSQSPSEKVSNPIPVGLVQSHSVTLKADVETIRLREKVFEKYI
jgi:hypothetical protein